MGNYSRFYVLLNRLPVHNEQMKEEFVSAFTNGRTSSLREMTTQEYNRMCEAMEVPYNEKGILRACRSTALNAMQRLGIDTTDWARINSFCLDKRIAGTEFAALTPVELTALTVKLRGLKRRGGLNPQRPELKPVPRPETDREQIIYMPLDGGPIC